jgi:preprotein translocase subunit YajC
MWASIANAAGQLGGGGGAGGGKPQDVYSTIMLFGLMAVIFYFFLIRPQSKRQKDHQAMINELKRGDEVATTGGIIGKIHSVTDKLVVLEIAQNVRIRVLKAQIAGKHSVDASKEEE